MIKVDRFNIPIGNKYAFCMGCDECYQPLPEVPTPCPQCNSFLKDCINFIYYISTGANIEVTYSDGSRSEQTLKFGLAFLTVDILVPWQDNDIDNPRTFQAVYPFKLFPKGTRSITVRSGNWHLFSSIDNLRVSSHMEDVFNSKWASTRLGIFGMHDLTNLSPPEFEPQSFIPFKDKQSVPRIFNINKAPILPPKFSTLPVTA